MLNVLNFIETLDSDERRIMKTVLANQIEEFFDASNELVLPDESTTKRFYTLTAALRKLSVNSGNIPANGIAYLGKPRWITRELLENLQAEALQRRDETLDRIDHFLGCGGKEADNLSVSPELLQFVKEHVGPVRQTGIASYLYYDLEGSGIRPHVDTDVFSINLILMLLHKHPPEVKPSATVVFPCGQPPEAYRLQIGEVMIMYGSSVIHTRSIVHKNEIIHLLTIGFDPIQDDTGNSV